MFTGILAALNLAIWAVLALARGQFWRAAERDDGTVAAPAAWPPVVAVVPARDEADCIVDSIGSLLSQSYDGDFSVVLVDDQSRDGTADRALRKARDLGQDGRLTIVNGTAPPAGWTGKLWSQQQGIARATQGPALPRYLLLTDADITHAADTLQSLVARAEQKQLVLTSLMAKLRCESPAERLTVPAFIFFFQMLYPFAWVNDPARKTAAAAGGCMLAREDALRAIGGIAAIRSALIDDCALGAKMKAAGPVWLGLTNRVLSIRAYPQMADIARMVTRSAYAQLHYSPLLLLGTIVGMALTYLAPVGLAVFAEGPARVAGLACWLAMTLMYLPIVRFYRIAWTYTLLLPFIAALYTLFTLASALQYARGRGGMWKGRAQANVAGSP